MHGVHYNWRRLRAGKYTHPTPTHLSLGHVNSHCLALQHLLHTLLLVLAALISGSILTALQFPAVLSSPAAALAFAIVTTFSLGTIAAITGDELAPLPMYALFLVRKSLCFLAVSQISISNFHFGRAFTQCCQFPGQSLWSWPYL